MRISLGIHVKHEPALRRRVAFSRVGTTIYIRWRVPMLVGRRIALARRAWLRYLAKRAVAPTEAKP